MADERPDWFPGALAAQDAYQGDFPDRAPVRITVRPQMEVAPPKSFEDYLGEAMTPREADTLQRPPVFGLTNRYVDPNDPTTQAGAQRLSNYYGLPGRLLTGDPRNTIQPEVPGQWSDRDEARAALQAGNMTLGGMGMGVDATTGAMPRGFAGTANTLGVGGGRPPRIGNVADPVLGEVAALNKPALSGEVLPPVPLAGGRQLAGVSAEQRAKLGPMVAQLEKLGATPEQMASFTPQEAYDFIKARNMPQPIRRTVDYRDPSGRPTQTAPLPIGTEQAILGRGYDVATGARPPGPQPPLMQAAERKGPIMGEVADLTTPSGIRAYHGSPHDFERFEHQQDWHRRGRAELWAWAVFCGT